MELESDKIIPAQFVRILDVILVGPWMIWAGSKLNDWILIVFGVATIVFNGWNYYGLRRMR